MIKLVDIVENKPVQLELDFDGEMDNLHGFAQYVKYAMELDMRTLYSLRDTDAFPLIDSIRMAYKKHQARDRVILKYLARDLDGIRAKYWK